jgi:hypothetical protein
MMNAAAAWFVGFKGDFGFDSIGDSYTLNNVSIAAESPTGSKLMYRCPMLA